MYNLIYIGKATYQKREDFIKEAKESGVNRCMAKMFIKNLNWGDKIFVADYDRPIATVYGYFTVDSINFSTEDRLEGFHDELNKLLSVEKEIKPEEPIRVYRRCGSYLLKQQTIIKNSISDLMDKATNLELEMEIRVKAFISGEYHDCPEVELSPLQFSQGLLKVDESKLSRPAEHTKKDKIIGRLGDYQRKQYYRKAELKKGTIHKEETKEETKENRKDKK